jgi:hypothetical protein
MCAIWEDFAVESFTRHRRHVYMYMTLSKA